MADKSYRVVIVQAVSSSRTSFVIRRGAIDGIGKWQESLFSNDKTSFYARAIEVNRHYSLWQIRDTRGKVPFAKGDFIEFNPMSIVAKNEEPPLELFKEDISPSGVLLPERGHPIGLRSYYTWAFSEAVSSVDAGRQEGRHGLQLEAVYFRRFKYIMDWGVGLRFDREVVRLLHPTVETVTYRYLVSSEFNYHFKRRGSGGNGHFFVGLGVALGHSRTRVQGPVQSGFSLDFAIIRFGHYYQLEDCALTFEIIGSSLAAKETFKKGGKTVY